VFSYRFCISPLTNSLLNHFCGPVWFFPQAARDDKRRGISFASELKKLTKASKQYRGFVSPPLQLLPDSPQSKDERSACSLAFGDLMEQ